MWSNFKNIWTYFCQLEKYTKIRNDILHTVTALKYESATEFERMFCDAKSEKGFCISDDNMKQLENFQDNLQEKFKKLLKK